jgi:ABC-2 type transport system permease protein
MIFFSSIISDVINLIINLIVIVLFMALNHVDFLETTLWLPLILVEVYLLGLGLALFLSAAFVKFRDISYIWEVILQAGFYLTPILYAMSLIPSLTAQKALLLNPMAQAIQDARYATITHATPTIYRLFDGGPYVLIPFALVFFILIGGLIYFRKESKYFAENI